jgi:hypothetical protein
MAGHPCYQDLSDEYGRGLGLKFPLGNNFENAKHCSQDSLLEQDANDPLVYTKDSAGIGECYDYIHLLRLVTGHSSGNVCLHILSSLITVWNA